MSKQETVQEAAEKYSKTFIEDDALGFKQAEAGKLDGEKGTAPIR